MATNLDMQQVIQQVYNEVTQRLKVDAELTANLVVSDVTISHTNDSIQIGDGTHLATVNPDGSFNNVISGWVNQNVGNTITFTSNSTQDIITRSDGKVITITYTDSTKATISTIARTS